MNPYRMSPDQINHRNLNYQQVDSDYQKMVTFQNILRLINELNQNLTPILKINTLEDLQKIEKSLSDLQYQSQAII